VQIQRGRKTGGKVRIGGIGSRNSLKEEYTNDTGRRGKCCNTTRGFRHKQKERGDTKSINTPIPPFLYLKDASIDLDTLAAKTVKNTKSYRMSMENARCGVRLEGSTGGFEIEKE